MWVIFAFVSVLVGLWLYAKFTCGQCVCPRHRVKGKTVVITGGNAGIGRCCSIELVRGGANLIIGCRNTAKAETLKSECADKGYGGTIQIFPLDLQSFASVRKFADEVKKAASKVDVLINNAGIAAPDKIEKTEDGHEVTFQTNYLSPFLLTNLLLPIVKRDGGRIVMVSSVLHLIGSDLRLAKDRICPSDVWNFGLYIYGDTKLAINYWTKSLAQKLYGTGISVNCCHPGYVDTDIFSSTNGNFLQSAMKLLSRIYAKTPEQGADPILHLVLCNNALIITGLCAIDSFELPRRIRLWMGEPRMANIGQTVTLYESVGCGSTSQLPPFCGRTVCKNVDLPTNEEEENTKCFVCTSHAH